MKKYMMKISRLPLATLLILAGLLTLLPACTGGGGGSGTGAGAGGITYAGMTTPASLTESNANILFSAMWNGGAPVGSVSLSPAVSKATLSRHSQDNRTMPFIKQVRERLSRHAADFSTQAKSMKSAKPINDTYNGKVSGTETDTGSIDPNTGTGTVTATYANFNDGDGYTYDGDFTATIYAYDMAHGIMTDWTMSCTLWTVKSADSDVSLSGSIREQKSYQNKSDTLTVNVDGRDNISKETFRFSNYVEATVYDNLLIPSAGAETYSGRMYVGQYGYVDISTVTSCVYANPQGNPDTGGPIIFAGAGNSRISVTPVSISYVRIEVDADGDSVFESRNAYAWGSLGGAPLSACVADAGPDRTVSAGSLVTLDGSGSTDLSGGTLTYAWTITAKPAGSGAVIASPSQATTSFVADVAGSYTITLVVGNGSTDNSSDTVVITATGATTSTGDQIVSLATNDIIYDPLRTKIYASVPSRAGNLGNTITVIDPATGATGTSVFVGSEPGKIAISDDGQFLYVSLNGAAAVRRLTLATMTPEIQFSLGSDSFSARYVDDMEVLPGQPHSVAIARKILNQSPRFAGVAIYDDGIQRPATASPFSGSINAITFSENASTLYGYNNETTGFGFYRMNIDASGVSITDVSSNTIYGFSVDIVFDGGLVYATSGRVANPGSLTPVLAGPFPGIFYSNAVRPDSAIGRTFFVDSAGNSYTVRAFDQTTFTPLGRITVQGNTGVAGSLIRWGASGLAFRTSGDQIFILKNPVFQ